MPSATRNSKDPGSRAARPLRVLASFQYAHENPFLTLLYGQVRALGVEVLDCGADLALREPCDILHLHWPNHATMPVNMPKSAYAVRANIMLGALDRIRAQGTRVVWTVHNLHAHEAAPGVVERWFWAELAARVDGFVALTKSGLAAVRERWPQSKAKPGFVIPHGDYRSAYPNTVTKAQARAQLGVAPDAAVIAYCGLIRPYKGVEDLMRAFAGVSDKRATLLVAGKMFDPATHDALAKLAAADARVRLIPRFLPPAELQVVLNAADLVALPFREVQNSGSAMLALSFNRPILAPALGSLPELQQAVGPAWVRLFPGALSAEILGDNLVAVRAEPPGPAPDLSAFAWADIGAATVAVYRELLAAAPVTSAA